MGKFIERVAIEFNQLQFMLSRGKSLPFVNSILPVRTEALQVFHSLFFAKWSLLTRFSVRFLSLSLVWTISSESKELQTRSRAAWS
jgi:hypothetical protein